jgi:hypothetical protein
MPKKSKANKRYRRNRGLKTFKYSSIYQKRKTRNHKYKNKNVRTMKKIYGGDDDFLSKLNFAEIQDNKKKAKAAEKMAKDEAQAAEKAAQAAEKRANDEAQAAEKRANDEAQAAEKAAKAAEKAQRVAKKKATGIFQRATMFDAVKLSMREAISEARKKATEKAKKEESAALTIQNKVRRLITKRAEAKAKEAKVKAQEQEYEQNYGTSSNRQPKEDTLTKRYRQAYVLSYDKKKKILTQRNRTAKASRLQSMRRTK